MLHQILIDHVGRRFDWSGTAVCGSRSSNLVGESAFALGLARLGEEKETFHRKEWDLSRLQIWNQGFVYVSRLHMFYIEVSSRQQLQFYFYASDNYIELPLLF
jgi:hypothetical protein